MHHVNDSIFIPPVDDPAVKELYSLLKQYIFQRKIVTVPKYIKYITPDSFSYSSSRAFEIIQRLKGIKRYKIRDANLIINLFSDLFREKPKVTLEHMNILKIIVSNPLISYKDLAFKMKISKPTAKRKFTEVSEWFKIHFASFLNPFCIKMKRFFLYFVVEKDKVSILKNKIDTPFTMNINTDVFTEIRGLISGWAVFYIPNNKSVINKFKKFIISLYQKHIISYFDLYEQKAITYGVNLDFYDGTNWYFDSLKMVYSFNFLKENCNLYSPPDFLYYKHCSFNFALKQKDLTMLFLLMNKARMTLSEIRETMLRLGYDVTIQEISRKRKIFFNTALKPYARLNNIGLTSSILIILDFPEDEIDSLSNIISRFFGNFFPLYFMTLTNSGIIAFLEVPPDKLDETVFRIKVLLDRICDNIKIIIRYYNIGSKGLLETVPFWNERKQRWDVPKNLFLY